MKRHAKSTVMVIAGIIWLLFSLAIVLFLIQFLEEGAGIPAFTNFFGLSSFTIGIGLVQFVGFSGAAFLCAVIGLGLYAHGVVPAPVPGKPPEQNPRENFVFFKRLIANMLRREEQSKELRCVLCQIEIDDQAHICPKCGWTQPYEHDA